MENQDKIYEQFKEAAGKAEGKDFVRMDAVWNRVEEKLDNKKQRRIATWWKYTGIAAALLLFMTIGLFVLNNDNNNTIVAPTVTPQNNVTVIDTQKVKKAFDPAKAEPKEEVVDAVKPQKTVPDFNETKSTSKDSVYFIKERRFVTSKEKNTDKYFSTDKIKFISGEKKTEDNNNSIVKGYATASPTGDVNASSLPEQKKKYSPLLLLL